MLVQWVGVGVRWGWGWESSIVTWIRLPGLSPWLYQRMVAPLYIRWRAGGGGGVPRQHKIQWDHSPSSPHPSPWKKSKKGGSLWQDTHREQQRVCFFYLFLSLKEVKRRPGVNSSIPGWWWPPPPRGCWAPELSGGVLCHSQNNQKKNQSWEAWSLFTWMCFVCCAVVNTRSQLVHFIFQDRATLSPLSFYTAPCPSPTCAFSCRAL